MTIDLDAIKARAAAATEGPWIADGRQIIIRAGNQVWHLAHVRDHDLVGPLGVRSIVNAEFIAAARTDVPALVAEVERLTAERDQWRRVAEYGWHLHNYGENAPGGTETWREFEQLIRAAADQGQPA